MKSTIGGKIIHSMTLMISVWIIVNVRLSFKLREVNTSTKFVSAACNYLLDSMVKIRQSKNGNGYFYLKILQCNCLSEKHGIKKKSLVNLTCICSQMIDSNIPSSYELCFHARSRLNRSQNKRSGLSSSTGFLTVRLASGIWLSVTYKHQKHLSKP